MRRALESMIGKGRSSRSDVSSNVKNCLDEGLAVKHELPPSITTITPKPKECAKRPSLRC